MKKNNKIILISIILILSVTAAIFVGCVKPAEHPEDTSLDFDGLGSTPTEAAIAKSVAFDKSKIKLSDEMTEDQEVLDSIEYLLRTSNQNLIDCDFFAAAAYGTGEASINNGTIVGGMDTREVRVFDNGEYYFDSYGLIVKGYTVNEDGSHGSVPDNILGMLGSFLNYTKRTYSPDGQTFYTAKNGDSNQQSIVNFPSQNAITYKKPKSEKQSFDEYMKATNSRTSYKGFTTDNYDNDKPITAGLIRYDKESGIYYLECDINCSNNTLELSVADMASNGAIKHFEYAKKHLTIEFWECGLIRSYINENVWKANMILGLSGSSDNYYEQKFTYDKSKLDNLLISQDLKNALVK